MPYIDRPGAKIFFDAVGSGEPIITMHGFHENGTYWGLTGVSGALAAAGYRVIDMDMRGHGRSASDGPGTRYDVETVAADIGALADHLGFGRFHLLTHATGGIASLRYAMHHSERLLSITSTDTGSATVPFAEYCDPSWDDRPIPADCGIDTGTLMSSFLLNVHNFRDTLAALRKDPTDHPLAPFLNRFDHNPDPERCWRWAENIFSVNNLNTCADFAKQFFADPDPKVKLLRAIKCPSLVIVGQHDYYMVKPCECIARCIPNSEFVVMEGMGHMTAIEDPQRVVGEVLRFLAKIRPNS